MTVTSKEIQCDNYATCGNARIRAGSLEFSIESARIHGYHVWTGYTMGGRMVSAILCDECIGRRERRHPKSAPMEGDQPLF
jgi:hypothetical protein